MTEHRNLHPEADQYARTACSCGYSAANESALGAHIAREAKKVGAASAAIPAAKATTRTIIGYGPNGQPRYGRGRRR